MSKWKTVRLGDVCEIVNGFAFKSDKYVDSGIRVIRITNVQKGFIEDNSPAFYPITEKETLKDYELHENDLLISLTGNVGRVALLSKEMLPAALNQRVGCIRIRDKNLLISYLFTFLNSDKFESDCIYSARGIAQKNMSTEWLKNYIIPLPPIEVQKKISNNLNTCTKIIKKHNKQLNNFDLLIKSRFIEMFGEEPVESGKWKVESLGDCLISIENGKSFVCSDSMRKGKYPAILKLSAVTYGEYNQYENKALLDEDMFLKNVEVNQGDLLFTRKNTPELVGMAAYVFETERNLMMPDLIFRLNVKDDINKIYLWKLINHPIFRERIRNLANGSAKSMSNISKERLQTLKIPVPPLELQNTFAAFVQQIDKSKFAVQKSLEKAETLYKSLMQEYFG